MTTYTNAEIRGAILRAADRIEQNPALYCFDSIKVPDCGTPGCMLGWINYELGQPSGETWQLTDSFIKPLEFYEFCDPYGNFHKEVAPAVAGMRAYADLHFPAAKDVDKDYLSFKAGLLTTSTTNHA